MSDEKYGAAFWERMWRTAGIQFVVFFIIVYFIYGYQPGVGASGAELTAFYGGERMRILIAVVLFGLNALNLMWFAAAVRATLADAGQDGWGSAATASSAALGAMMFVFAAIAGVLAFSIAGGANAPLTSGLNDLTWAGVVLSSFPRAMLSMSAAFGLWRAGMISNTIFAVGVGVVILGVLGGTTWMSSGIWAPDGIYQRFIWPAVGLVWILIVSRVIIARDNTRAAW